jgi:hypothetical protein
MGIGIEDLFEVIIDAILLEGLQGIVLAESSADVRCIERVDQDKLPLKEASRNGTG